jgi:DNA repair exonuclease SbcCD ATPase subunit
MFIKKLELTNFKCHTSCSYEFGQTNHFFGDNYTGKSSIGESIVFCLFGVTKHGYKGFVKDYLQEDKDYMKVNVVFLKDNQEYTLTRTMNAKGTTSAFLNRDKIKDKEIVKLLGDYNTFIYCFFPEVFPEEEKSSARSYIIKHLLAEKDEFDLLEKEKSQILKQQKNVESSRTFYEGQKAVLNAQIETMTERQRNGAHTIPPDIQQKKLELQNEIADINMKLEKNLREGLELSSKIKAIKDKCNEAEIENVSIGELCPTCHQTVPVAQVNHIRFLHKEKLNKFNSDIDLKEKELESIRQQHSTVKRQKTIAEESLAFLEKDFPIQMIPEQPTEHLKELKNVEVKITELLQKKINLAENLKKVKHQLGELANSYQNQINQYLTHTKINLFKQLKNGELRTDFLISYKNRPYRVLSNSEKIRCMLEIITVFNQGKDYSYPIFLDNLESVTHLTQPNTQIITATVKKDVPLTLKIK